MITSINFYISGEFDDLQLRELVAKLCDVLDEEGLASEQGGDIRSVGVVKLYSLNDIEREDLMQDIFTNSLFTVLPITSKGEESVC